MCVRNAGRVSAFDGGDAVGTVSGLDGRLSGAIAEGIIVSGGTRELSGDCEAGL